MTVRHRLARLAVVHLMVLGGLGGDAAASVVVPLTLAELSQQARVIVDAKVIAVHTVADIGRVERVVSLRVLARWKGEADGVLHLRLPGGTRGRTQTIVTGVPPMRLDDRFILFLADAPAGAYRVLGLHQGAWRVQASPVDGAWLVGPASSASVAAGLVTRGDGARRPQPLDAFRATVRALATGGTR